MGSCVGFRKDDVPVVGEPVLLFLCVCVCLFVCLFWLVTEHMYQEWELLPHCLYS